jgi:hypothetical protein
MKKFLFASLILVFFTMACSANSTQTEAVEDQKGVVTIFALEG